MNNEDLNKSDIWNYYDNPCAIIRLNNSFPDGKTQRRQRRAKKKKKRKGRL